MARNIIVRMKDGTVKRYPHQGRAGGSYTKSAEYKGAFLVITDEWYNETAIPASDIAEVTTTHEG